MPGPTGLLIGGVRLDLAVRVDSTAIFLRGIDDIAKADARAAVQRAGTKFKEVVQATVAYDTGFMHDHVRVEYTPQGYAFEGGWNQDDFDAAGLAFYPPFVELGTSRMQARPSIEPAYREVAARLDADLAATLRASLERGNAGRVK